MLDAGTVTAGGFVDGVRTPVRACRAVACADGKYQAGRFAGADDRVARPRRAMHEVPPSELALFAFDDQQRFAGQDEEVLLVGFPVVHRHRLARPEKREVDPELQEVRGFLEAGALELAEDAATAALPPLRLACVEHEPALPFRNKPMLRRHELRLGNH